MPTLVPELSLSDSTTNNIIRPLSVPESLTFLRTVVKNLDMAEKTFRVQTSLLQMAKEHLNRLSEMDKTVAGAAKFLSFYIEAQLLMSQILEKGVWLNPTNLATQQANNLKTSIHQLLQNCLMLQQFFVGLSPAESCLVKQFRLRAMAMDLVYFVKVSNASALAPCHHFLSMVEDMHRELYSLGLEPDYFTASVFNELSAIEEPKPGTVARILIPLLTESKFAKIPEPNVEVSLVFLTLDINIFMSLKIIQKN